MAKTEWEYCRICLTTSLDDNITDSTSYIKVFTQVLSKKVLKNLWLCMWCRKILKRTQKLIKVAQHSEEVLKKSENKILVDVSQKVNCYTLTCHIIDHIDILPDGIENDEKTIVILNSDCYLDGDNEILHASNELNEVFVQNELNYVDKIEKSDYQVNDLNKETKIHEENAIETAVLDLKYENETDIPTKNNRQFKYENGRRELNLDELKFEVKYLNLEEQLKEVEMKRMKYKDMNFQCAMCGIGFQTNDYYEEHAIRHTEAAGPYKCKICHLHFKTRLVLSQHTLSHRRQFKCTICGVMMNKWSNCAVHRHKCGGSVLYVECPVCCKVFSDEHSLKVHKRNHNTKTKYTCEKCGRQFSTKQRLIVHTRSHSGEKPFTCAQCGRGFSTQSNLKAHSTVHCDISAHYCVECDTRYKTAKSLKRHLAECARHLRDRTHMFSCSQCDKEFLTEKSLQNHEARHSVTQQVVCPHCEKTFSNKSNLNKHVKCIHKTLSS